MYDEEINQLIGKELINYYETIIIDEIEELGDYNLEQYNNDE